MSIYINRINTLCEWMQSERIDAVVIEDYENRRSKNLMYLSGMNSDSLFIIFADAYTVLVPWDMILAEKTAEADRFTAYGKYDRSYIKAVKSICSEKLSSGRIEIASTTPFVLVNELSAEMNIFEIVCRADGLAEKLLEMRSVKDNTELSIYRRAGAMTDRLIDSIESGFRDGSIETETDAAMLVEAESRRLGAEGSSFETLAAGPERSWGIHCVPSFGKGPIGCTAPDGGGGLSIIDCGLRLEGYATDITLTICRGELSDMQQKMVELVAKAHRTGAEAACTGATARSVAAAVDGFLASEGWTMPHSLGHGIGLDVHEAPTLKNNEQYEKPLLPGMVFTIEPGLYHAAAGGVRFENDYIMTEKGAEAITSSRILMLR